MRVANLLSAKGRDVATIDESSSVAEAVALLKERHIGALVVTGASAPLPGSSASATSCGPWPSAAPRSSTSASRA